jgi:hypothetical protein
VSFNMNLHMRFHHECSTSLQSWSSSMAVQKLSWTLDWSQTRSSSILACTLTWLTYLKTKVYYQYSRYYQGTVTSNSVMCKWNKKYTQNLWTLTRFFLM